MGNEDNEFLLLRGETQWDASFRFLAGPSRGKASISKRRSMAESTLGYEKTGQKFRARRKYKRNWRNNDSPREGRRKNRKEPKM